MRVDQAVVRADNLTLGYGDATALAASTFSIPSGSVTVVIGPNGSGKSTLLNAIADLVAPISGVMDVAVAPSRISYVLQATRVSESLPMSVREVVSMGRYAALGTFGRPSPEDRQAVDRAMERSGVVEFASRQLHHLSGGQRQRVFVAQGLAQPHDLLLLDEPLTGIDLPTAQAIDDLVHEERDQGQSIIMSTHDLTEANHADHVILLSGRVVASGPPEEALTRDNLSAAYGPSLIHPGRQGVLVDDPAHQPVTDKGRQSTRVIHTEPSPDQTHPKGN